MTFNSPLIKLGLSWHWLWDVPFQMVTNQNQTSTTSYHTTMPCSDLVKPVLLRCDAHDNIESRELRLESETFAPFAISLCRCLQFRIHFPTAIPQPNQANQMRQAHNRSPRLLLSCVNLWSIGSFKMFSSRLHPSTRYWRRWSDA